MARPNQTSRKVSCLESRALMVFSLGGLNGVLSKAIPIKNPSSQEDDYRENGIHKKSNYDDRYDVVTNHAFGNAKKTAK